MASRTCSSPASAPSDATQRRRAVADVESPLLNAHAEGSRMRLTARSTARLILLFSGDRRAVRRRVAGGTGRWIVRQHLGEAMGSSGRRMAAVLAFSSVLAMACSGVNQSEVGGGNSAGHGGQTASAGGSGDNAA